MCIVILKLEKLFLKIWGGVWGPGKSSEKIKTLTTNVLFTFDEEKGHSSPHFSAHVYCGQTAGWIQVPLGMEVGLGPDHIVLDGNPAPPKNGYSPPIFDLCLLWPNDWMDQDVNCYGGLGDIVLEGGPSFPYKGAQPLPTFWPCLLWPNGWTDQDATWY